jgi:arsenate reductase
MIEFYGYNKCSTCVKAKKLLNDKAVKFNDIDITTNPPSVDLLENILKYGDYELKDLFNKSGQMYRELNMKEKMNQMSKAELMELLSQNGRLVKRPIIVNGRKFSVGFDVEKIKQVLE